jgi:WD40 repeat protein
MIAYPEALIEGESRTTVLWVLNARADVLVKIPFSQSLDNLRWLDDEHLIFYTPQTYKDGAVLIFNPFTRVQSIISNELPGLDTSYLPGQDWLAEYSSDLQSVVYIAGLRAIVRDVVKKKTLWESLPPWVNVYKPIWSPDGSRVAIVQNEKLFIINPVNSALDDKPILDGVSLLSWSPDSRYIALWDSDGPQHYILMVYDTQLKKIINFCVEDVYPTTPLWSPKGQQVVVNINSDNGKPILLDIQKRFVYRLTKLEAYPLEWMNSLP